MRAAFGVGDISDEFMPRDSNASHIDARIVEKGVDIESLLPKFDIAPPRRERHSGQQITAATEPHFVSGWSGQEAIRLDLYRATYS